MRPKRHAARRVPPAHPHHHPPPNPARKRNVTISCTHEELQAIDARAAGLGLSRNAYVLATLREERLRGGDFILHFVATPARPYGVGRPPRRRPKGPAPPPP